MPLLNVKSPGNVNAFNNFFDELATFNYYDPNDFTDSQLYSPEMEPISLNFQNAGFDGPLVVHNLRLMFYVFLLHIVAALLMVLLVLCAKKSQKIKKVKDKASSYLFWNGTIRFLLENYLDFCMFSFINLQYADWSG